MKFPISSTTPFSSTAGTFVLPLVTTLPSCRHCQTLGLVRTLSGSLCAAPLTKHMSVPHQSARSGQHTASPHAYHVIQLAAATWQQLHDAILILSIRLLLQGNTGATGQ